MADDELVRRLAAFTSRPRATVDATTPLSLEDLPPESLQAATWVWRRRVMNEGGSVAVAQRLVALAPVGAVASALGRLEQDETHHERLARDFVLALGAPSPGPAPSPPEPAGSEKERFASLVFGALLVGETVSAARYAMVRAHTDVPRARAAIEVLLRDEVAHAELGFVLAPLALSALAEVSSQDAARARLSTELSSALGFLDRAVGLDAERRGLELVERPQPLMNLGVVEPMVDALAFYRAVHKRILPGLASLGFDTRALWAAR